MRYVKRQLYPSWRDRNQFWWFISGLPN